jgi:hypothetical protein
MSAGWRQMTDQRVVDFIEAIEPLEAEPVSERRHDTGPAIKKTALAAILSRKRGSFSIWLAR